MSDNPSLEERLERLQRRLRTLQIAGLAGLLVSLTAVYVGVHVRAVRADDSGQVLRVRGLVVEDAQGRPRILLGAPVPKVSGRKRQDDATGFIIIGENGADRVSIGAPNPAPQIRGQVAKRISPGAGLVFDDTEGNERGGMGVLDNGRGVACLDYATVPREAICMGVLPDQGYAGLAINGEGSSENERAEMAVTREGMSVLKIADTDGNERAMLLVRAKSQAQLLILDPNAKTTVDAFAKIKP